MKRKLLMATAGVALLGLTGCGSSGALVLPAGTFPSLKIDIAAGETTRDTTDVIIAPVLEDGEIVAFDVTAFGMTFRVEEDDIVSFGLNTVEVEVDGFTLIFSTPFATIEEAFAIISGEGDDEDAMKMRFKEHVAGFIFKFETPEGEEMDGVVVGTAFVSEETDEELPPLVDVVATFTGNETEAANVGAFVPEVEGDQKAYYVGKAAIIEGPSGEGESGGQVIEGTARLHANFTDGTIGGYITGLRAEPFDEFVAPDSGPADGLALSAQGGYYGKGGISDVILINETDIEGSSFETDLSLLRGSNQGAIGSECGGPCSPGGEVVDGFFSDSQVDGQFFGAQGEEVGGTIAYTRTQDFETNDLNMVTRTGPLDVATVDSQEPVLDEPITPVEAIGVFSTTTTTGRNDE